MMMEMMIEWGLVVGRERNNKNQRQLWITSNDKETICCDIKDGMLFQIYSNLHIFKLDNVYVYMICCYC